MIGGSSSCRRTGGLLYGSQRAEVELRRVYAGPSLVGEARRQPRVRVASCVDGLTVVEVVEHHGGRVRPLQLSSVTTVWTYAIGELDLKLCERGELVAVEGAAAAPAQPSAKPTIAQRNTEHRAWLKK